ncbi:type II toxin-antitoxin system VapC family toxin [Sphingobium yanoikuyae]|uniref:Ribonuclease VapC n=1 Tax=Sphingobium yanoikuyae TaxID=13690 RepID=A0AA42X0T9_SPHYA|nr:type II toxin-antitoxin system VapC family toxin [Sphingobium yanoikuyae]MDH2133697.1 type II toxin-antitoxin system VapC family toxin [Sphingobium yanoikuyae]MDH2150924.1 type II toxin-antitoxin system VapC family toxin [Sphingobium yanoikuyae]MDH2168990.1 type II toxin-antitoxin system VapC family toxin [Sphingobium yanoikuyae]
MIVIDTSAIMAILLDEPEADRCIAAIAGSDILLMSAGTLAETLIVADRRSVGTEAATLIDGLGAEVVPVTPEDARRVAAAYTQWGKGLHPAALNFGDCFGYALARERDCPLLFIGEDFARTDIVSAA